MHVVGCWYRWVGLKRWDHCCCCGRTGLQGTNRPAHYHVLVDQNKWAMPPSAPLVVLRISSVCYFHTCWLHLIKRWAQAASATFQTPSVHCTENAGDLRLRVSCVYGAQVHCGQLGAADL